MPRFRKCSAPPRGIHGGWKCDFRCTWPAAARLGCATEAKAKTAGLACTHEAPDQIACTALVCKCGAFRACGAGSDMANHRSRDLDAAVSPKAEAEREVDVFDIAEEPLIEPAVFAKGLGADKAGRATGSKDLSFSGQLLHGPAVAASPRNTGREILVPAPSSLFGSAALICVEPNITAGCRRVAASNCSSQSGCGVP
jgi:hypothetical protein